jgi:long-chain fatty acid transport protein
MNPETRLGVAYRSNIKHTLKGSSDWTYGANTGVIGAGPCTGVTLHQCLAGSNFIDQDVSLDVDTPESLSANVFHKLNDTMDFMADITYTKHSRLDYLDIDYKGSNLPNTRVRFDWRDTYRLSAGMNYQMNEAWKLRGGFAYDQAPTKNDEARHPSLPDSDRTWISVGANYKMAGAQSVDFALTHVSLAKGNINYTDEGGFGSCTAANGKNTSSCQTVRGSYDISSILLGVQFNQSF